MGLDQYAWAVPEIDVGDTSVDYDHKNDSMRIELAYWRKFNHLQGWMEDLYRQKGGKDESFNLVSVRLNLEDLGNLEKDIINKELKPTSGFFFGSETLHKEDVDSAIKFIKDARQAIKDNKAVFYDSWW